MEGAARAVSKRRLITLTLAVILVLPTGCVYYNTFYHARSAAREAEILREARPPETPPSSAELDLLERAAEKCGRVIQLHPESAWADDALLLLGTTHYHQERYESAERRLSEFLTHYPESDLLPDAQYMLASVLLKRGNPVLAETYLEPLAEAQPRHRLSDDALVLIGRAYHDRKQYDEAAEAYERVLEQFSGSDRRAEVRFLSAENYLAMDDLDSAAIQYSLVPSERGSRTLAFESRMRLAQVDLERGRPDESLEVLNELERRTDDRDELDRVQLLKGRALEGEGDVAEAIATYENLAASHKRSDASAEAFYRIGLIHRDHYEQLDAAIESFQSAKEEASRSDAAALANEATRDIEKLRGFLATIEESERAEEEALEGSLPEESEGEGMPDAGSPDAEGSGTLVEEIDHPEGAVDDTVSHVTLIPSLDLDTAGVDSMGLAATAGADTAAAYAVDTTDASAMDTADASAVDTTAAPDDTMALQGPEPPAGSAEEVIAEEPVDEIALARFRMAELYLFRFDDAERARTHYESVVEQHPDSPLAPKAALALAWIMETHLDDPYGARAAYRSVASDYPDTDFAAAASEALERMSASEAD